MLRRQTIPMLALAAVLALVAPTFAAEAIPVEGTWTSTITPTPAPPGFPSSFAALETYSQGGGLVTSNALPAVPRPGQGVWEKDANAYHVVIVFQGVNLGGPALGSAKIDHRFTLNGKDSYSGSGTAQFFDANGNLLFSITFSSQGQRMAAQ